MWHISLWRLHRSPILEETRVCPPPAPSPLRGRVDVNGSPVARPPDPPAPIHDTAGSVTNQPDIDAALAAITAWSVLPEAVLNQAVIDQAVATRDSWITENTKLYDGVYFGFQPIAQT